MAVMMGNLYAALRAANVDEPIARQAAEEMAGHENRFARLEADTALLKWMVGFNLALTGAISGRLFLAH
jgi:hypothetical protein